MYEIYFGMNDAKTPFQEFRRKVVDKKGYRVRILGTCSVSVNINFKKN